MIFATLLSHFTALLILTLSGKTNLVLAAADTPASLKIAPGLAKFYQEQEGSTTKVIILFTDDLSPIHKSFETRKFADRGEKISTLVQELTDFCDKAQKPAIEILERERSSRVKDIKWRSYGISNHIFVDGADLQLVNALAEVPNVAKIIGDQSFYTKKSFEPNSNQTKADNGGAQPSSVKSNIYNHSSNTSVIGPSSHTRWNIPARDNPSDIVPPTTIPPGTT